MSEAKTAKADKTTEPDNATNPLFVASRHRGDDDTNVTFVEASVPRNLVIRRSEQGALLSCRDRDTGEDVDVPVELKFLTN